MNATLRAALNESERLLVDSTTPAELDLLDEDGVAELHDRIRRARNKYIGLYRRGAATKVSRRGGRGIARPTNQAAALKAEAFEDSLARVSRRLAALAKKSAADLRTERLDAARAAKGVAPASPRATKSTTPARAARKTAAAPKGDRALRSPASEKNRAGTKALGARRQAKRDGR